MGKVINFRNSLSFQVENTSNCEQNKDKAFISAWGKKLENTQKMISYFIHMEGAGHLE